MLEELSLHILDIAENSIRAGAANVEISLHEDRTGDRLRTVVADDGRGIPPDLLARIFDPFVTTRTERRVGLGLALLRQAAEQTGGTVHIDSTPGSGTRVEADFALSHPDRQPVGDLGATIAALLAQEGGIRIVLTLSAGGYLFRFDSRELEEQVGPGCFSEGAVLAWVAELVNERMKEMVEAPEH